MQQLKPVKLSSQLEIFPVGLAPMAGYTSSIFRQICRRQGAGFVVTELVSARGLVYDPKMKHCYNLLQFDFDENPVFLQLFGNDPTDFAKAISIIMNHPELTHCAGIDINMGCPAPKVVRGGSGAALLNNTNLAAEIVDASVKALAPYGKPVTVKCRIGYNHADEPSVFALAKAVEQAGAALLTVHGRTRDQFYSGEANWQIIEEIARSVRIPVLGNGDIRTAKDFAEKMANSALNGAMIGRGATGNPWLFASIKAGRNIVPTASEWCSVFLEHVAGEIRQCSEYHGVREMRKQTVPYLTGVSEAAKWRRLFMAAETYAEYEKLINEVDYDSKFGN